MKRIYDVLKIEDKPDIQIEVTCPDITIGEMDDDCEEEMNMELLQRVDRWSNCTWESDCHIRMCCLDSIETIGGRYIGLIATIRVYRDKKTKKTLVLGQRLFTNRIDMDRAISYVPIEVYTRSLESYFKGEIIRGENAFVHSNPNHSSALISWVLFYDITKDIKLIDLLKQALHDLSTIENIYASRMTYLDLQNANEINKTMESTRKLTEWEMNSFKKNYGITVDSMVGVGGVATTWKAINIEGKEILIKLLAPDPRFNDTKKLLERFKKEYRIGKRLSGYAPIPQFFDFGEIYGRYFYTIEYLPYPTLRKWLEEEHSFEEKEILIRSIIKAVTIIHSYEIIHRDISPKNILVNKNNEAILIDFGTATEIINNESVDITKPEDKFGSLKYTAPELRDNGKAGTKLSDIFSLGIIIYEVYLMRNIVGNMQYLNEMLNEVPKDISIFAYNAISFSPLKRQTIIDDIK